MDCRKEGERGREGYRYSYSRKISKSGKSGREGGYKYFVWTLFPAAVLGVRRQAGRYGGCLDSESE